VKDELGNRMKADYEDALRLYVPRRTHVVLRLDGRGFHTFTAKLERPYCRRLADALDEAALKLCHEMIGCRFAYGQSDEYSFVLSDMEPATAPLWFEGNIQKIVSVSASLFTGFFNKAFASDQPGVFDSRLLVIGQRTEVEKYLLWRQLDASANSLNMLASAHFSHEELDGRSTSEKHDLLHGKGINWAKEPADFKRGRAVIREGRKGWRVDRDIPVFNRVPDYLEAALAPR
jgi:tRNA(His) guanylyltransferase